MPDSSCEGVTVSVAVVSEPVPVLFLLLPNRRALRMEPMTVWFGTSATSGVGFDVA